MFDKEIEALAKCTELIKELEDNEKFRVVKYLIEKFNIGLHSGIPPVNYQTNLPKEISGGTIEVVQDNTENFEETKSSYLTLRDLMIKNYPKSETEWVLCYAFYSSKFGSDTFSKEQMAEKYRENNRFTANAQKNFASNIKNCIKKDWFKTVNDAEFLMLDQGLAYAKQIIAGNSSKKERKATKRKSSKTE